MPDGAFSGACLLCGLSERRSSTNDTVAMLYAQNSIASTIIVVAIYLYCTSAGLYGGSGGWWVGGWWVGGKSSQR